MQDREGVQVVGSSVQAVYQGLSCNEQWGWAPTLHSCNYICSAQDTTLTYDEVPWSDAGPCLHIPCPQGLTSPAPQHLVTTGSPAISPTRLCTWAHNTLSWIPLSSITSPADPLPQQQLVPLGTTGRPVGGPLSCESSSQAHERTWATRQGLRATARSEEGSGEGTKASHFCRHVSTLGLLVRDCMTQGGATRHEKIS